MMEQSRESRLDLEQAGEELFNFAVDREDVMWLVAQVPETVQVRRSKVEYELQILKIISVGWGISYYLGVSPHKGALLESYWGAVQELSRSVSATAGQMTGQAIDYFQTVKERLDGYVTALARHCQATEPAAVIGPEFARTCGQANEIHTIASGTRMFLTTLDRVKQYIDARQLVPLNFAN